MTFYAYHTIRIPLKIIDMGGHYYIFLDYSIVGGDNETFLFTDEVFYTQEDAEEYLESRMQHQIPETRINGGIGFIWLSNDYVSCRRVMQNE